MQVHEKSRAARRLKRKADRLRRLLGGAVAAINPAGVVAAVSFICFIGGVGGIETERLTVWTGAAISSVSGLVMVAALYIAGGWIC